jgi:hypothetical protein
MYDCGVLCDSRALDYARSRIPAELATRPYLCRFIDTTTASPWNECYDPRHPMTRTESREWKMKLLSYVSKDCKLVTGSETGHDAAVPFVDYFEGMLSLGPYRVPDAGRDIQRIWNDPPERVVKFQLGQAYRLPLWELVYHDCVVAQWYWGDYNNKLPALWDKRDLFNVLYGTPPMFMFDRKLWETQKARFVQSYTNTCPYVRAAGYAEMTDHRFLTIDRNVQQTAFANGVTINRVILVRNEPHLTHDGGVTWFGGHTYPAPGQKTGPRSAWVCNGLVVTTAWHFYIDPFEPNRQYICYTDIGLARSTDAGQSWIWWGPKSWSPWRNTCYEMAFDPETPGKIWGAFSDVHDIPNDNIVSERHGHQLHGGVCLSTDFGVSWKSQTEGLPRKPVTSIVLDPTSPKNARTLYAGVFDEGVFKSTDDGKTWTLKKTGLGHPDNMRVYRVILHHDGTLFAIICAKRPASGQPLMPEGTGLYRSKDGAETW